eukprot:3119517-Rhodomonas_salina.1
MEAGWVSLAQIRAILRWMRENKPREAWYPPQAIGLRPFHEHASVLEDCEGQGTSNSSGGERIRRKVHVSCRRTSMLSFFPIEMEQKEWQHPASPPRAKVERPHWDPPEPSGLITFDFTEAERRELPFDENVWRCSGRVFIGDKTEETDSSDEEEEQPEPAYITFITLWSCVTTKTKPR